MWRIILFLALLSCSSEDKVVHHFSGIRMTIPYHFQIVKEPKTFSQDRIESAIEASFQKIDSLFNCFNPHSELSKINQWQSISPYPTSQELCHFLRFTSFMVNLSEGRFDPSIRPLLLLWRESRSHRSTPSHQAQQIALESVGWHHFQIGDNYVLKDNVLSEIDLSGICKGYFLDLLKDALSSIGIDHFLLEWGGEFVGAGDHPENRPWSIVIKNPKKGGDLSPIPLSNCALATSGDYEECWEVDGRKLCHIIDLKTGAPLQVRSGSIASASVMAPTCAIADAIATTLMTFSSLEEAEIWLQEISLVFPTVQAWLIAR